MTALDTQGPASAGPTGHLAGRSVSPATYLRHHCRCDGCTAANTAYKRAYRARRRLRTDDLPGDYCFNVAALATVACPATRDLARSWQRRLDVARARHGGMLTMAQADYWAVAFGYHPAAIWPAQYWRGTPMAAATQEGKRHAVA